MRSVRRSSLDAEDPERPPFAQMRKPASRFSLWANSAVGRGDRRLSLRVAHPECGVC